MASGQEGKVFVENRECTSASAEGEPGIGQQVGVENCFELESAVSIPL